MKYYKVVNKVGWDDYYVTDKIYPETYKCGGTTVAEDVAGYPNDFVKVTKAAYNKQEDIVTKPELKQTEMENYSIEGSKALKTAFVEECGLKTYTSETVNDKYFTSEDMPKNKVQGTGTKKARHFVLPTQWNEAVEYVKKFNSPKEPKVKTFKEGDYVVCIKVGSDRGAGWEQGLVFKVTSVRDGIAFGGKNSNGVYFTSLRKATKAEIESLNYVRMDGYLSYIDKEKTVNFGCKSFTADDVKCIIRTIELCEYIGRDSMASIEGFKVNTDTIGLDKLNIILKQLQ